MMNASFTHPAVVVGGGQRHATPLCRDMSLMYRARTVPPSTG